MSKLTMEGSKDKISTRRSQRKKNKISKKSQPEYSIPNPYRSAHSRNLLPSELGDQLSKFDYLSMRCLQSINFVCNREPTTKQHITYYSKSSRINARMNTNMNLSTNPQTYSRCKLQDSEEQNNILSKMRSAATQQQRQFEQLVSYFAQQLKKENLLNLQQLQFNNRLQEQQQQSNNDGDNLELNNESQHRIPKNSEQSIQLDLEYGHRDMMQHSEDGASIFGQPNNRFIFYSDHSAHNSIAHGFPKEDFDHYLI